MLWVGTDLKDYLVPIPMLWAGTPITRPDCSGAHSTYTALALNRVYLKKAKK